jgi:predicted GNAT family N-acyltransferase
MSLKGIDFEWKFKRLELDTKIKPFESESKDLNAFLFNDSRNYLAQMLTVTYLFETDTETIAYFSILNDTIKKIEDKSPIWNKINRKIPFAKNKGSYPSVKIGRLAVTKEYAGNGFGKLMLQTVREMYIEKNQRSGCRFITVDAKNSATDFYLRNNFNFLTETDKEKDTRLMYFDIKSMQ